MSQTYAKKFSGHCSGCDRTVRHELPMSAARATNRVWVRCYECETAVCCSGANMGN